MRMSRLVKLLLAPARAAKVLHAGVEWDWMRCPHICRRPALVALARHQGSPGEEMAQLMLLPVVVRTLVLTLLALALVHWQLALVQPAP
jgi:hypothetical protein